MAQNKKSGRPSMEFKRCHSCGVELPLDARICTNCRQRVGKIDKLGRAREPVDWKAYTLCVFSWILFGFFIWWGFFREG